MAGCPSTCSSGPRARWAPRTSSAPSHRRRRPALRADSARTFLVVARHTGADAEPIVWFSPSRPALGIEASRLLPHGSPEGPDLPWWVELIASSGAAGSAELAQLVARSLAAALDGWTAQLSVAELGAP